MRWDANVVCTHCVALGEVTCATCGLTGVPLWDDEHPDGTRYTVPNHSTPLNERCHGSYAEVVVAPVAVAVESAPPAPTKRKRRGRR